MLLKEALGRAQEILDLNDAYATVNWMIHEVASAVANDLWHHHVAESLALVPAVSDAESAHQASAALKKLCDKVSALELDDPRNAIGYIQNLEHELVVVTMDLEIYHFDVWDGIASTVSHVKLLTGLMADYLPENMSGRDLP